MAHKQQVGWRPTTYSIGGNSSWLRKIGWALKCNLGEHPFPHSSNLTKRNGYLNTDKFTLVVSKVMAVFWQDTFSGVSKLKSAKFWVQTLLCAPKSTITTKVNPSLYTKVISTRHSEVISTLHTEVNSTLHTEVYSTLYSKVNTTKSTL